MKDDLCGVLDDLHEIMASATKEQMDRLVDDLFSGDKEIALHGLLLAAGKDKSPKDNAKFYGISVDAAAYLSAVTIARGMMAICDNED